MNNYHVKAGFAGDDLNFELPKTYAETPKAAAEFASALLFQSDQSKSFYVIVVYDELEHETVFRVRAHVVFDIVECEQTAPEEVLVA